MFVELIFLLQVQKKKHFYDGDELRFRLIIIWLLDESLIIWNTDGLRKLCEWPRFCLHFPQNLTIFIRNMHIAIATIQRKFRWIPTSKILDNKKKILESLITLLSVVIISDL